MKKLEDKLFVKSEEFRKKAKFLLYYHVLEI